VEVDSNLTLVRPVDEDRPLTSIEESVEVAFQSETDVTAFRDGATEQCVLPVVRTLAMLATPTCDLSGEDYWLFIPLRSVETYPEIKRSTLHSTSKGYGNLFGIYANRGVFEESFVNFHDLVSVPSEPFRHFPESRIANLSKQSQSFLQDKLARFLSRGWGYAPHEKVEISGFYRCRGCMLYYGLPESDVYLNAGDNPPKCKNCSAIKRESSWELLVKHKRSRPMKQIPPAPSVFTRTLRLLGLTRPKSGP